MLLTWCSIWKKQENCLLIVQSKIIIIIINIIQKQESPEGN